jgi:hypothetical protein
MPNRTDRFQRNWTPLIVSTVAFSIAAIGDAFARDDKPFAGKKCSCVCRVQGTEAGDRTNLQTYNAVAHCFIYNNKTCNMELSEHGVWYVRTGKLEGCHRDKEAETANQGEITTNEPGKPPKRPRPAPTPDPTAPAKPRSPWP